MVGELVETLHTLGVADRTVILFTADHGDLLGDHGLFFKSNFFQGAWHVPFALYAPGRLEAHGRAERFVATQDVYPTLLSLAGVPLPGGTITDGTVLTEDLDSGPSTIFGSVGRGAGQVHGVRSRRWCYAVHPHGAYEALYDLQSDPGERHNLADTVATNGEAHTALEDLRAKLETWLAGLGDTESLDEQGHLRLDPAARGWQPAPPPRVQLGLRPY